MSSDQQAAARIGYGDDLMRRIEANTAPTANKAKVLQSLKRDEEAQAMTLDPPLYQRRLGRENEMWETQNRALGGSRTADNQADVADVSSIAGGLGGAARSALNFQLGDATAGVAGALGPVVRGQNDATRQKIVQILLSDDPAKALAPVLRQQKRSDSTRRIIESADKDTPTRGYA